MIAIAAIVLLVAPAPQNPSENSRTIATLLVGRSLVRNAGSIVVGQAGMPVLLKIQTY